MSLGLIKFKGFASGEAPNPVPALGLADLPSKGTPSITYKGLEFARTELLPLILTVVAAPG